MAQDLVFSARGEGPFVLGFGNREAKAAAFSIESLIPGYRDGAENDLKVATIVSPPRPLEQGAADRAAPPGSVRTPDDAIDVRKWILWSCLGAGVLFLAWMAWRLMKQMDAAAARKEH